MNNNLNNWYFCRICNVFTAKHRNVRRPHGSSPQDQEGHEHSRPEEFPREDVEPVQLTGEVRRKFFYTNRVYQDDFRKFITGTVGVRSRGLQEDLGVRLLQPSKENGEGAPEGRLHLRRGGLRRLPQETYRKRYGAMSSIIGTEKIYISVIDPSRVASLAMFNCKHAFHLQCLPDNATMCGICYALEQK